MKYLYALIVLIVGLALCGHFDAPPLVAMLTVFALPALVLRYGPKP